MPFGSLVPSDSVRSGLDDAIESQETGWVEALTLFKEAVKLAHLVQGCLLPSTVFRKNLPCLFPKWLEVLWVSTKIVKSVSSGHGGGVNGSQAQQQLAMGKFVWLAIIGVSSVHHPLKHV